MTKPSSNSNNRRAQALTLAGAVTPNTRANAEAWLGSLGIPMIDVTFLRGDGSWQVEKHVDDELTIAETIAMTLRNSTYLYALRPYHGRWELRGQKVNTVRYYDSKEAAEMVAIHRG